MLRWSRGAADPAYDGIPAHAFPAGAGRQPGQLPQRDFDLGRGLGLLPGGGSPPAATAVLITSGDGRADWLRAGQALHRLLAHAAGKWVFASLYTQPPEAAAIRTLIHDRLPGWRAESGPPARRFTFHVLAAMDEMLADLISEGTREGLESARARGRAGGCKPKLTTRQAEVARGMYDETGADDRRKYTVAEIAETFGVSRKTVYRHLEPSADRRQPGKGAAGRTRRAAGHAAGPGPRPRQRASRQTAGPPRGRAGPWPARPAGANPPPAARHCSNAKTSPIFSRLHLDGDHLTEARHCAACQPGHGPVIDVSCSRDRAGQAGTIGPGTRFHASGRWGGIDR